MFKSCTLSTIEMVAENGIGHRSQAEVRGKKTSLSLPALTATTPVKEKAEESGAYRYMKSAAVPHIHHYPLFFLSALRLTAPAAFLRMLTQLEMSLLVCSVLGT